MSIVDPTHTITTTAAATKVQALENAAYRADKAFGSTPYRLDLLEFEPAHEGPDEQHSTAGPARRIDQRTQQVA